MRPRKAPLVSHLLMKGHGIDIFISSKNEDTFIKSSNNALAKDW